MPLVDHDLAAEFPEHATRIRDLRVRDTHFAWLLDEYNVLNRDVLGAETGTEPLSHCAEIDLRKRRVFLKNALCGILTKAA